MSKLDSLLQFRDCPCPPLFKDVAYCDDCPYRNDVVEVAEADSDE